MIYKFVVMLLLAIIIIGVVQGDLSIIGGEVIQEETASASLTMDQKVEGNGFYNSNQKIVAGALHLLSQSDGSGNYSHESRLSASTESSDFPEINEAKGTQIIAFKEKTDFAYAPTSFSLGKSFKLRGFRSLGKEGTCVKNTDQGISMSALFDSTSILSKDLSADLKLVGSVYSLGTLGGDDTSSRIKENTNLDVNAAFTGKGHIGAQELNFLDADETSEVKGVHDVGKLIDEDYIGTFSLARNMSSNFEGYLKIESDEGLSCCPVGYLEMPKYYQSGSKGFGSNLTSIFDCTCPTLLSQGRS